MFILRMLKWVVITFVVLIVAGVLYVSFGDLNWLKPRNAKSVLLYSFMNFLPLELMKAAYEFSPVRVNESSV
jgi:hypothetical protein